jgi:hypothetical protein
MLKRLLDYARARLAERSTWNGIAGALGGAGMALGPGLQEAVIAAGIALFALVNMLFADKKPEH